MDQAPPSLLRRARSGHGLRHGCLVLFSLPVFGCAGIQAVMTSSLLLTRWLAGESISVTYPAAYLLTIVGAAWISVLTMIWLLWTTFAVYRRTPRPSQRRRGLVLILCVLAFAISWIALAPATIAPWFGA